MGQQYLYHKIWVTNIVIIILIYVALAMFLLFCDHQNTESESLDIEIGVATPIFTHKVYQRLYGTMISILYNMGAKYCGNCSYIYGARNISLLILDCQYTKSDGCEIEMSIYQPICINENTPHKIYPYSS